MIRPRLRRAGSRAPDSVTSPEPGRQGQPRRTARGLGNSPVISKPVGGATVAGARFALLLTATAWLVYLVEQSIRVAGAGASPRSLAEAAVYLALVTLLTASAAAYLLSRLAYFERIRNHRRVPRSTIDDYFDQVLPTLTILIPSYREEERIVRHTLLSAALQEHPHIQVVLLIDDPPDPVDPENREILERSRGLIASVTEQLRGPRLEFEQALASFEKSTSREPWADSLALELLATHYDSAAGWFEREEALVPRTDHIDEFLAMEFLDRMAQDLRTTAEAVRAAGTEPSANISIRRVHQMYSRLARTFQAELSSFERKQFASLSHEANKAMNLNSYLGLMGGSYRIVPSPGGRVLIPAGARLPDLIIPDSQYVLTLDADSILLPEYCLRLVYFMEQPENSDVAVVQTPYSAYRGAATRIERIAGATTDIQYIAHQGLTNHDATSWVGANAVIRKRALEDLEVAKDEAGFVIRRFISDRTVIEDTESSIDLRARGWRLYNYPERLSYSATPPDFGSLVIQRLRWATGGLVILPKLFRLGGRRGVGTPRLSPVELFLRANYLASLSWASLGLLLLLFYPFDGHLLSRFAVLTALPYFWAMASDLKRSGHRRRDILQIYGFNLLLLPVNLAGTIQSIIQAIGGQKFAFARTPKVRDHTVAPWLFLVLPLLLIGWSAWTLRQDIYAHAYFHGAFAAANLAMTSYACLAFIGINHIVGDVFLNLREFIYRPVPTRPNVPAVPHWASVIYVGSPGPETVGASAGLAVALAAQDLLVGQNGEVADSQEVATAFSLSSVVTPFASGRFAQRNQLDTPEEEIWWTEPTGIGPLPVAAEVHATEFEKPLRGEKI